MKFPIAQWSVFCNAIIKQRSRNAILACVSVITSMVSMPIDAAGSRVEAGTSIDTLDKGYDPWYSYYLNGSHKFESHRSVYGGIAHIERYKTGDQQVSIGTYQPIIPKTSALFEANFSREHVFLPTWSSLAQLDQQFLYGWIASLGWTHREYDSSNSNSARLTVERYWGNYRAGYSVSFSRTSYLEDTVGQIASGDYYYGDLNRVSLGFAFGDEVEKTPTSFIRSGVRSIFLRGTHMLAREFGADYQLTLHEQGQAYTRKGVSVGLRYLF